MSSSSVSGSVTVAGTMISSLRVMSSVLLPRFMGAARPFRLVFPLLLLNLPLRLLTLATRLVQVVQSLLVRSMFGLTTPRHNLVAPFVRFPRSLDGRLSLQTFLAVTSPLLLFLVLAVCGFLLLLPAFLLGLSGVVGMATVCMFRTALTARVSPQVR